MAAIGEEGSGLGDDGGGGSVMGSYDGDGKGWRSSVQRGNSVADVKEKTHKNKNNTGGLF